MEQALIEAIHTNKLVAAERVAHINPRSKSERLGGCYLVATAEPGFIAANSATPQSSSDAVDIAAVIRWFQDEGAPFHFVVRPDIDRPLYAELVLRGFDKVPSERVLVLESPAPQEYSDRLVIREVTTEADIENYGRVGWQAAPRIGRAIARTAASLGFTLLLGELDGQPVACSMAVVTGRLAGLYNVGVEEDFRRRGFGAAITWAAIEAAMRRGASTIWLGSTDMGLPLYRHMGFVEQFDYLHLQAP
jgi:GNAT superfamily N-acetyltransferase